MPRGGKKSDDPRVYNTRIRMSSVEHSVLEYCSLITGKKKATIIREGIWRIYRELVPEQDKFFW